MNIGRLARALACVAAAAAVHALAPPPDALRGGLALFVLIGGLWMTQALHLTVTALLVAAAGGAGRADRPARCARGLRAHR